MLSKDYQLRHKFDLTLEEYNQMLEVQEYKCPICLAENGTDKHAGDRTKQLSVDHDHQTGVVRGLLCNNCNRGIGQLGDSLFNLRRAVAYLERHEAKHEKSAEVAANVLDELMKL